MCKASLTCTAAVSRAAGPVPTAAVLGGLVLLGGAAFAASFPSEGANEEKPSPPVTKSSASGGSERAVPPVRSGPASGIGNP